MSAFFSFSCLLTSVVLLAGCSEKPVRQAKTYAAGEKAAADKLIYSVVDTEIHTRLGDDSNPRVPQNRFIIIQLAVSNSANADLPIPGVALIDAAGKVYPELADGVGVPHWLGVLRKVGPGQTERGSVVFDAPSGEYKLKLTDETSESDVFVEIPLTYVHEQMNDVNAPVPASPAAPENTLIQPKKK